MFTWSPAEQKTHFNASYREAAMQWLSEIGVPQAQYPNFDSCVWWYATKKDHSEILFCWDSNANRLYIIEQFL